MSTTTTTRKSRIVAAAHGLKSLAGVDGNEPGTFEAVVSVFGNVDLGGDRMVLGAFASSLERWKTSGDPIPVVFAHQWDDLDAHVGIVLEAEELAPGDPRLPAELRSNGGLWTKFRLDVDEDFAGRLAKRLDRRSIREFSFAYDVIEERTAPDGANELVVVDLIELGPCLKGMNPATSLLSRARKALGDAGDGMTDEQVLGLLELSLERGSKAAPVSFVGSVEERQAAVLEALTGWAVDGDVGSGGFYALHLEATFDDRVVFTVEGWNDPLGTGAPYEAGYSIEDGVASLEEPHEVVVEATTRSKGRRSAYGIEDGAIVSEQPKTGKGKGKTDEVEDPDSRTDVEADTGSDPALAELEIAEVELAGEEVASSD